MIEEKLTASELIRRLSQTRDSETAPQTSSRQPRVTCVWMDSPLGLFAPTGRPPNLIKAPAEALEDLFAVFGTLARQVSPVSALIHCAHEGDKLAQDRSRVTPDFGELEPLLVALIAGEALTRIAVTSGSPEQLAAPAFIRTLSYSLSRARGFDRKFSVDDVFARWSETRHLIGDADDDVDVAVYVAWQCLLGRATSPSLSGVDARWLAELGDLIRRREQISALCRHASVWLPDFAKAEAAFNVPFDLRYQEFSSLRDSVLAADLLSVNVKGALLGLAAALVDPSSLRYAHLVAPSVPSLPTALLWYSACASISEGFSPAAVANGAGLRVLRELNRPFDALAGPTVDVTLEEMRILRRGSGGLDALKPMNNRVLTVGLQLGVEAHFRLQAISPPQSSAPAERALSERLNKVRALLEAALTAVDGGPRDDRETSTKDASRSKSRAKK